MMKRSCGCRVLFLLALLIMLGGLSVRALAAERGIDTEREGSIHLSLFYENQPVSGGNLRLYLVGKVEEDDGNYAFRLLDSLGGERLDQKALDSPDLTERLAENKVLSTLDYRETVFGTDGIALFDKLTPGLYLLIQTKAADGFQLISPLLVSVPYYADAESGYVYDVDASVKPAVDREAETEPSTTKEPEPFLPQTGQLNWPVPVLAAFGLIFTACGVLLLLSDRRRRS